MEFNLKEYALAMDKLIVGLERVPSEIHTDNAVGTCGDFRVVRYHNNRHTALIEA